MVYLFLVISIAINTLLVWYVVRLVRKFMYISQTLADLHLTTKAFQVFVKSLYSMDNYHGEPMIQELVLRIGEVQEEIEVFREVFEYTLDEELEEELDDIIEEEAQETN
jgi:hypothetical protein